MSDERETRSNRGVKAVPTARAAEAKRSARRKGHLELARGEADARLFTHLLLNFLHRTDQERRGMYSGDLDLAAVGETVGLVAIEPESRKPEFREKFGNFQAVIGVEGQRPVNALTISAATGIPRETVRRKLKLLLERGVITEKARGAYVIKPGFIQRPENLAVVERAMRDTLQFMNDCVKLGLVSWVDEAE
jgi:predicted transcriptional regulator